MTSNFRELEEINISNNTVDAIINLKPKFDPILSKDEQTPMIHYYRAEIGRLCIYKQRLDSTVNWTITCSLFILNMIFQKLINYKLGIILSLAILLLFHLVDVRRYTNYDDVKMRCDYLEKGMYSYIIESSDNRENKNINWKDDLLKSWIQPNRMTFFRAFYMRFRNVFVYLYAFHLCVYLILVFCEYSK